MTLKRFFIYLCLFFGLLFLGWWWTCLPEPLFNRPLATEVLDRNGELLSAGIAADGQWRMAGADSVDSRLSRAVVAFEDRRFYAHWGVDMRAIGRALRDNIRARRVVSGGSTISMQVARMARGNRARTLGQKFLEALVALRLEVAYDKDEILGFWLDNAPFGGNVVGVGAACRRYFGRDPSALSWAEAATLAVLPNSPALIHPGRNRDELRDKRNRLLDRLAGEEANLLEPLPGHPLPLPRHAPHLLDRLRKDSGPGRYRTTVDADLQARVGRLLEDHHRKMAVNGVHNLAVMVTDVATAEVRVYHGNAPHLAAEHAPDVDCITAPRSPGSLLKPILYARALNNGTLLPSALLPDVPTSFGAFSPVNFNLRFDGAVAADEALARSLNLPFVELLSRYGQEKFYGDLGELGFQKMDRGPDHYGLSLILGGGEVTMEEVSAWFLGLARRQRFFHQRQGRYAAEDFSGARLLAGGPRDWENGLDRRALGADAGAGAFVVEALRQLTRPGETGETVSFASHQPVAWKTGTSFGFRDAWAVGCTPAYVVSVWVGNADGEGRDGLVGSRAAAPLLFSIIRALDHSVGGAPRWFEWPVDELIELPVCRESGWLAGRDCPREVRRVPRAGERARQCSYHKRVIAGVGQGAQVAFELPPRQAHFRRQRSPIAPAVRAPTPAPIQLVYPDLNGYLHAARDWTGTEQSFLFLAAPPDPGATLYWHLDGRYLRATQEDHQTTIELGKGPHTLRLTDGAGNYLERRFSVK